MRYAWLSLVILAVPAAARADGLFPATNPYACIYQAKASAAPDAERRRALAVCMAQTLDPYQSAEALRTSGFNVGLTYDLRRAWISGDADKAYGMLAAMIENRPYIAPHK